SRHRRFERGGCSRRRPKGGRFETWRGVGGGGPRRGSSRRDTRQTRASFEPRLTSAERRCRCSRQRNLMADFLKTIEAYKRREIAAAKVRMPFETLARKPYDQDPPRGFVKAIEAKRETGHMSLIAEIKKASPS